MPWGTTSPQYISNANKGSSPSNSASKPLPTDRSTGRSPLMCPERHQKHGGNASDRSDSEAPQGWETEFPAFDFTASPGAEEWQIDQVADGRAVYSTVCEVGDRITVEFQKWDW